MQHPFLADDFHVRWSALVPEAVEPDIRHALAVAADRIEAICRTDAADADYDRTFGALEEATRLLDRGWGRLQHLDAVCDEPAQRAALNAMLPEVSAFYASIPLNERLWQVLKGYGRAPAAAALDPVRRRFVEETIAGFVESGADLPPAQKQRIAAIEAELSQLTKNYAENVLDSTNAWQLVIDDEALLAGLPGSARAAARANARAKGLGTDERPAWRFTLQFPSMMPVLQHLDDAAVRRQVWEASVRVASSGGHDNTALIWRILELRHEKAALLGHGHFADLALVRRMARDGATALGFVEDLHDRIAAAFQRECRELQHYRAEKAGGAPGLLEPWEAAYWAERRRKEHYDLDDEQLRPYFPVDRVMAGLFELAGRLFGIRIEQRPTVFHPRGARPADAPGDAVETWHPEVTFHDMLDAASGEHLGSFYADWHPRESKRAGAWMNSLHTGLPGGPRQARDPHLGLIVGNMSPPVGGRPALLTHAEVETIFHEFGHLLHHLLSEVPVRSLAGTNVPWDFVELPSQIMENFCWARESLDLFARHHESGAPIPQELFERMLAARNYLSASAFMRQLAFAKLDLELHIRLDRYRGRDLEEVDREILAGYRAPFATEPPTMARRFNHLFSNPTGYAAGYYSYKWAEVLDADAFTRFEEDGLLNPETGLAFRREILSKGNSAPPEELFRAFRGRDPDLQPLLVRAGLA